MDTRRYAAIIADPPWAYESPRALVGNGGRGAEGASKIVQADVTEHYPTMPTDEICALDIPAADDCLLFMWVTNPFLADGTGAKVVRAWGFTPKTVITWAKVQENGTTPSMKTGHWFRSASEHVIFAVRGNARRPHGFPALPTWFSHTRLGHSAKPDRIHEYAEKAMPGGPWLEMFARRARPGWDLWGNQAPPPIAMPGTTGKTCRVCGRNTPYTDWNYCDEHNRGHGTDVIGYGKTHSV